MVLTMHSSVSLRLECAMIHHTWVKIAPLSSENDLALGTSLVVLWLHSQFPLQGACSILLGQGTGSYVQPNKYFKKGENDPTPET